MSLLGDFLERLYAPQEQFTSVRATVRYWQDRLYARVASDARAAQTASKTGQPDPYTVCEGERPEDRVSEAEARVWLSGTERGREEVRPLAGECWFPFLTIVNGVHFWMRSRDQRPIRHNAHRRAGCLAHADRHFSRLFMRILFSSLELEEMGSSRVAGHDCVLVRARPIPDPQLWAHWLPYGAEQYDLAIDPKWVTILSITAHVSEAIFETNEVIEVVYNETMSEELFTPPEPGSPIPVRRRSRRTRTD